MPHTLDLVPASFCWTMLTALEMKQTSHNAGTMGWEFTTVCPVKMLVFSAEQVNKYKDIGTLSSQSIPIARFDSHLLLFT